MKYVNPSTSLRVNGERSRTIKFFTLGCKANQYDTQSIRERFLNKGFSDTDQGQPDYFLINTCTVTSGADQKSRNIIRKCIRANPKAKVIVTGCLVEKDRQSLAEIRGVGVIIKKIFFPEGISRFSQHTRAFLKIQDGCSNFCAYCKVALVRGKQRSKDLKQVVSEAKKLVACGYKEIVLTGICLGAYGSDFLGKINLVDVIKELEKIKGLARIRLSSIEAGDVTEGLIKCLATSKKLCRHLHLPIQSGDDHILQCMNRKYTSKKYLGLIARLKRSIPQISITTDCLVGFPQETEENFKNTLDLLRKITPLKVHIFPYSSRPGTPAADFRGSIDPKVIKARCLRMKKTAAECRKVFMQKFIGKEFDVLIEGSAKDISGSLEGVTDNYLQVKLPFKPGLKNEIVKVRFCHTEDELFAGEYVDKP